MKMVSGGGWTTMLTYLIPLNRTLNKASNGKIYIILILP